MQGTKDWTSGLVFTHPLKENNGIVLRFRVYKANSNSAFVFRTGDWQTPSLRQFEVDNAGSPHAALFQGKEWLGTKYLKGNLGLRPETWYGILMAVGQGGEFLTVIWDPADSEPPHLVQRRGIGIRVGGIDWHFMVKVNAGETISGDDFYTFSFSEVQ